MFSKIFTTAAVVLALGFQANAHALVAPPLGVTGTPKRADVQRPSTKTPCGKTNIAATIDSSTAIAADAAGTFTAVATNFNAGADGSRSFTAKVDATGAGTNFVAAKVTTNGDAAPKNVGSQNLAVTLPAGTKCTGGKNGNTCLVQFVSSAGFGSCVAVTQGAAAAAAAPAAATAAAGTDAAATAATDAAATDATAAATDATAATTAATTTATSKAAAKAAKKAAKAAKKAAKQAAAQAAAQNTARTVRPGTTAARALLADLAAEHEARAEEVIDVVKRSISSWLFA